MNLGNLCITYKGVPMSGWDLRLLEADTGQPSPLASLATRVVLEFTSEGEPTVVGLEVMERDAEGHLVPNGTGGFVTVCHGTLADPWRFKDEPCQYVGPESDVTTTDDKTRADCTRGGPYMSEP